MVLNSLIDMIFLFAATLISAGYFSTNFLILRIFCILAAIGYIIGALLAGIHEPGMAVTIVFSALNLGINLTQSAILILDRKPLLLPDELKNIYSMSFSIMTPRNFLKVYKIAQIGTAKKGEYITVQNQPVPDLIYVNEGLAHVIQDGKIIASLQVGFFVGEMSFLTGQMANATVEIVSDRFRYISWNKDKISRLEFTNALLYNEFQQIIATNLIKKINLQVQQGIQ